MTAPRRGRAMPLRAVLLAGFLLAFTVVLVVVELKWAPVHRLDLRTDRSLHRTAVDNPGETRWWRAVSTVLSPTVLRVVALVIAAFYWLRRRRRVALFVAVTVVGSATLESVTKVLVDRARPVFDDPVAHAAGASFPSGHAMTSLTTFGLLVLLVAPRWRWPAIVAAVVAVVAVGFSRMALGVHYLSDVLAAWLLGTAWLIAVEWLFTAREPRSEPTAEAARD